MKVFRWKFFLPVFFFLLLGLLTVPTSFCLEKQIAPDSAVHAFTSGEVLKYDISWSNILKAGTAVMEARDETLPDGKQVLEFVLTGTSAGLVKKLYPVNDTVKSIVDRDTMQSLSYNITETYGRKKRQRNMVFDHTLNTVVERLNDDPPETWIVPVQVQDALASLYYLRTRKDFIQGGMFVIDVHESGKNWAVEVHTLGKEKVKTPAGEFFTIKIKTRPRCNGVFQNKGEVFIWLTDDDRKIPVLMKSTITVGSFVFSLTEIERRAPPST